MPFIPILILASTSSWPSEALIVQLANIIVTALLAAFLAKMNLDAQERARAEKTRSEQQSKDEKERSNAAAAHAEEVKRTLKITTDAAEKSARDAIVKAEEVRTTLQKATEVNAEKLEDVKASLAESNASGAKKLDDLATVAKATHTLVNSSMSAQLKISAVALRRIADLTVGLPSHEQDTQAADLAEKLYGEHVSKQAMVDAQPGTDEEKKGQRSGDEPLHVIVDNAPSQPVPVAQAPATDPKTT